MRLIYCSLHGLPLQQKQESWMFTCLLFQRPNCLNYFALGTWLHFFRFLTSQKGCFILLSLKIWIYTSTLSLAFFFCLAWTGFGATNFCVRLTSDWRAVPGLTPEKSWILYRTRNLSLLAFMRWLPCCMAKYKILQVSLWIICRYCIGYRWCMHQAIWQRCILQVLGRRDLWSLCNFYWQRGRPDHFPSWDSSVFDKIEIAPSRISILILKADRLWLISVSSEFQLMLYLCLEGFPNLAQIEFTTHHHNGSNVKTYRKCAGFQGVYLGFEEVWQIVISMIWLQSVRFLQEHHLKPDKSPG